MDGLIICFEKFFPDDIKVQNEVLNVELVKYKKREDMFGKPLAITACSTNDDTYNPVVWWTHFGNGAPKLQKMALRILSLTTSSSGCERNWSTFEGIHTKKRNRLDTTRLNNLVYVQFNAKLNNKKKRVKDRGADVLLANEASQAQGWIVEGGDEEMDPNFIPVLGEEVRELHEEDFISDDEMEVEGNEENIEFESDTERVVEPEGYGEEESDV